MSCGVGRRHGLDPVLLWLWPRLAATDPIRPLAWEPPYAMGEAPKRQKDKKKKVLTKTLHLSQKLTQNESQTLVQNAKL